MTIVQAKWSSFRHTVKLVTSDTSYIIYLHLIQTNLGDEAVIAGVAGLTNGKVALKVSLAKQ